MGAERLRTLRTRLLSLAAVHSDRRVNEELAGADARKWHYAVLATLDEFGPASQAQLSDHTRIYRSDLVAVLNELTERGQVSREPDPSDRRRNLVTITAAGHRQLHRLDEILARVDDEIFAPLDQRQREQLTTLLSLLVERPGEPPQQAEELPQHAVKPAATGRRTAGAVRRTGARPAKTEQAT
ncbi:MarR family winged helix-turn-helix transcriptional regulator [Paractinoplanes ovalisporus]|uniref:MarR family winged helix-turn-helix transcriptional regulator n=1 Tax=Paractinoplanes ovalisporus TaxID=2810368 RepID=UPI0027DE6B9A|nr:MarR family transcriptional regulator [Actinoplanes ovalisporus]